MRDSGANSMSLRHFAARLKFAVRTLGRIGRRVERLARGLRAKSAT
jgi:hypothetical protein